MSRKIFFLLIVTFILSIASACNKENPVEPGSELIGQWELSYIHLIMGQDKLSYTPQQANLMIRFSVKNDKTFSLIIINPPGTTNDSGSWSISSNHLLVKYTDGRNMDLIYEVVDNKLVLKGDYEFSPGMKTPAELMFLKN